MFKINSHCLLLLSALFFNNSNVLDCSSDSSQKSSITPQPCQWQFNSSTDTLIPLGWNPNNVTNIFNNSTIPSVLSPTQEQKILNEPNDSTATAQVEQSLFSSIFKHCESGVNVSLLFPSSSITPQPYNWPNSSTNTFIPLGWNPNSSRNTFNGTHNLLPPILDSDDLNNPFANTNNNSPLLVPENSISSNITDTHTNNNPIPSVAYPKQGAQTNENKDHVMAEKNKKKRGKKKKQKNKKTYTCPTCNKSLANKESLDYHLRTHNKNRPRPWECHICHNRFAEKTILHGHIQRHNKEKIFKCDYCVMRFKTKQEKIAHHRIHTGDRPYKCTLCDKCFAAQSTLRQHMRTHTGERQFKCNICQKGLSSKRGLKDHLNTHSGKKPYKCGQCTKVYTTKSGLYYHAKIHNRPKPYTCKYCGASFNHKTKYKNHIKYEEETDEDLKCDLCKKRFADKHRLIQHNKKVHKKQSNTSI